VRSEFSYVIRQQLRSRIDYITDKTGIHAGKGLAVRTEIIGVDHSEDLVDYVDCLLAEPSGPGVRRRYVALELTTHPTCNDGPLAAFHGESEMHRVGHALRDEFCVVYGLLGYHGQRDLHALFLNWGPTGRPLREYLPHRSNPRRVLVAVADRLEGELNRDRAARGEPELTTMSEVREQKRRALNRPQMYDNITSRFGPHKRDWTISDILNAIMGCGWVGVASANQISISFASDSPPMTFDIDLFLRGLMHAFMRRNLSKGKAHEK
jgi:hypothetical protein